ncbi:Uncharacterized protein APZ42_016335 [Daphnia magna]|uniref:Uncharacterized protein n=1 Tax=Daphnia magna TaxID=35525 RepID=A0A165ACS2_9CRUS|nr:Uncharacterized protein APZ42_016335 [Daphnia magna]
MQSLMSFNVAMATGNMRDLVFAVLNAFVSLFFCCCCCVCVCAKIYRENCSALLIYRMGIFLLRDDVDPNSEITFLFHVRL